MNISSRVVGNDKLSQLLGKDPNYREAQTINFTKCKKEIEWALASSIESLAPKYSIAPEELSVWKDKVMHLVGSRIDLLKSKVAVSQTKPFLQNQDVTSALANLHDKFVIIPIDKATKNIAIVWNVFTLRS